MLLKNAIVVLIATCALLLLTACESSTASTTHTMSTYKRAVVVSGGNSGGTTVFLESTDPSAPTIMSNSDKDVCADCKAAAAKYFQTGVLDPKCSTCGGTRTAIKMYDTSVGHQ